MTERRVKVRIEHKRNIFYDKFLVFWKKEVGGDKIAHTLYKALHGLRQCPLEVVGIHGLKQINGIGETIAVRIDGAWDEFCRISGDQQLPTLTQVKQITDEELRRLFNATKSTKRKVFEERLNKKAGKSKEKENQNARENEFLEVPQISRTVSTGSLQSFTPVNADLHDDNGPPAKRFQCSQPLSAPCSQQSSSSSQNSNEITYISCNPSDRAEVILIVDNREGNARAKSMTVLDQLQIINTHRFEARALSIGDYVWVARKIDGSEVVLDWVVERKTWRDLSDSIIKHRYEEQKQRLRKAPMRNRVYLVEGTAVGQPREEQALATTMVRDEYLIQRCAGPKQSAKFLFSITQKLKDEVASKHVNGIRFEDLQDLSKKPTAETVSDLWIRQLTVCPGMGLPKAQLVASRFPSMSALATIYESTPLSERPMLLQQQVPGISKTLSAQLARFFAST